MHTLDILRRAPLTARFLCALASIFPALILGSLPVMAADVVIDPYNEYRDEVGKGEFSYDDSKDIPWIENETEVLAVPRAQDLQPLRLDNLPPGLHMSVDMTRVTVTPEDRVVRLWLWVRSDQGAENGTFEGYRCETREYKVYAYANPARTPPVSKAKRPRWRAVGAPRSGNYRAELLQDYFCGIRGTRSAEEIRDFMTGEFRRETFMSH